MEDNPMDRTKSVVTPQRFATGMTFDQYVAYVATPENLKREGSGGAARRDWSAHLRAIYEALRLDDAQTAAIEWLAGRPKGPSYVQVIAEVWSYGVGTDVTILTWLELSHVVA